MYNLSDMFKANKLSLNKNKTTYMIFGSTKIKIKKLRNEITLDGMVILPVSCTKFLGIIIDVKLS